MDLHEALFDCFDFKAKAISKTTNQVLRNRPHKKIQAK